MNNLEQILLAIERLASIEVKSQPAPEFNNRCNFPPNPIPVTINMLCCEIQRHLVSIDVYNNAMEALSGTPAIKVKLSDLYPKN